MRPHSSPGVTPEPPLTPGDPQTPPPQTCLHPGGRSGRAPAPAAPSTFPCGEEERDGPLAGGEGAAGEVQGVSQGQGLT